MDGTDPIEADEADLLSDAAVVRLRAHPRFRDAVEAFAAGALIGFEMLDVDARWLINDLGRSSICLACVILDGAPEGLTFASLAQAIAAQNTCSRGRVLAFVQYALGRGWMTVVPGSGPWSRRPIRLSPSLLAPIRARMIGALQATAVVAPEVAEALPRLTSDAVLRHAATAIGALLTLRPDLNRNPGGPLRQIFLARDAGMRLLQHLMIHQAPNRSRLLEHAPLSRAEMARRYQVSRTHVNRLLTEAEAVGALRLVSPSQVAFSSAFSDEVEAYFAGVFQVNRTVAQMLLAAANP